MFFDANWACEKKVHVSSKFHQCGTTCTQTSEFFLFLILWSSNRLCMSPSNFCDIENLLPRLDLLLCINLIEIFTMTYFRKSINFGYFVRIYYLVYHFALLMLFCDKVTKIRQVWKIKIIWKILTKTKLLLRTIQLPFFKKEFREDLFSKIIFFNSFTVDLFSQMAFL